MAAEKDSFRKQAVRSAYGWGPPQNWEEAVELLRRAADAGEADADRELALVTQAPIADLLEPPLPDQLSDIAQIGSATGFAPPGFSEWLIDHASDRLVRASVNEASGSSDGERTARDCAFGPEQRDVVLAIMQERAARLVGIPIKFHEPPNVISYEPGQEFGLHADFLDPRGAEYRAELEALGQRLATIVTYLNDDFDGAETYFPDANVRFRGGIGDAIVFSNVRGDGSPDYSTRHAGLPPTRGRKWVFSQWIRQKPFPYRPEDLV